MSDYTPDLFGGNEDAARLVERLCRVAHIWDDLIDKDKDVSDEQINEAFRIALIDLPNNPFYREHNAAIAPLVYMGVIGYMTANRMERSGDRHQLEIAHGLRYCVAQVAAYAVVATNPLPIAERLLPTAWKAWMPERLDDYLKEHTHD